MNDPLHPSNPAARPTLQPQQTQQIPRPQHVQSPQQTLRPAGQPSQVRPPQAPAPGLQPRPVPGAPAPRPAIIPQDDAISLVEELNEVDDAPAAAPTVSKIKFGPDIGHKKHEWKRKTHVTGTGACRVKSFHAKYSEQGVEHMDDMINEWLDEHPDVEVKFVTQSVHVFEGKIREPALVLNVWY